MFNLRMHSYIKDLKSIVESSPNSEESGEEKKHSQKDIVGILSLLYNSYLGS